PEFFAGRIQRCFVDIHQGELRALTRERARYSEADAARTAGYQRGLTLDVVHSRLLLLFLDYFPRLRSSGSSESSTRMPAASSSSRRWSPYPRYSRRIWRLSSPANDRIG